jgi:hypothetical protein
MLSASGDRNSDAHGSLHSSRLAGLAHSRTGGEEEEAGQRPNQPREKEGELGYCGQEPGEEETGPSAKGQAEHRAARPKTVGENSFSFFIAF